MKKILNSSITGQRGVNLIEQLLLEMGCLWHSTGGLEAGTDGYIELRDPTTGQMLNVHLPVQSKATTGRFSGESDRYASYVCEQDDLDYWMKGNKPMILILSRPDSKEAYWVSLKDYFKDPELRKRRKVTFDKQKDRFDQTSLLSLLDIARSGAAGSYLAPPPTQETIISNLLLVTRIPSTLYHSYTDCGSWRDVRDRLASAGAPHLGEWTIRGKQILSVHDLSSATWKGICDRGTVEEFGADEWARSIDEDRRNDFVELLNQCLRARLYALGVRYDRRAEHFYFTTNDDGVEREVAYHALSRPSSRKVVRRYVDKRDAETTAYIRHHAFSGRFRQYDDDWFLQIDPTYRFTTDGLRISPSAAKLLSGIFKLEKNPAVLGQVVMWASLLADPEPQDLFATDPYSFLGFGSLASFTSTVGLDERGWLTSEDADSVSDAMELASKELGLFSEVAE